MEESFAIAEVQFPEYRLILHPTDGSANALAAAGHAMYLARATGAALLIIFVIDVREAFRLGSYAAEALADMRRDGERILSRMDGIARLAGATKVEFELIEGHPGPTIVEVGRERGADLIVMGNQGKSAFERLLIGSVSKHVLKNAPCAVQMVPTPAPPVPDQPR